jgi:hypothetical protein
MGVEGTRFAAAASAAPAAARWGHQGGEAALARQLFHHLGQQVLADGQTLRQVGTAVPAPMSSS